jgi:rRNA maturation protein Rpf1
MIISHLPYGPTAYFTLANTVMRHDIPDIGTMSEAFPHLIFHNFSSKLGERVGLKRSFLIHSSAVIASWFLQVRNILKFLFPVPKEDSKRIMTFANDDDFISFRYEFLSSHFIRLIFYSFIKTPHLQEVRNKGNWIVWSWATIWNEMLVIIDVYVLVC